MPNTIVLRVVIAINSLLAGRLRQLRRAPDAGLETADKILWAAGVIVIAGGAIAVFHPAIVKYATNVMNGLGL